MKNQRIKKCFKEYCIAAYDEQTPCVNEEELIEDILTTEGDLSKQDIKKQATNRENQLVALAGYTKGYDDTYLGKKYGKRLKTLWEELIKKALALEGTK